MAHIRGHRAVYDAWAAGGAAGWGYEDLLPYFWRSEHTEGRHPVLRGTAGPVRVAPIPEPERHPVAVAFAAALAQAGYRATADLSGAGQEGVAWVDLAIHGGQRVSPADAYLTPARSRSNLTVQAGCLVTGLQVRYGRCAGVSYLRDGVPAWPYAVRPERPPLTHGSRKERVFSSVSDVARQRIRLIDSGVTPDDNPYKLPGDDSPPVRRPVVDAANRVECRRRSSTLTWPDCAVSRRP